MMLRESLHARDGREGLLLAIEAAFDRSDSHQYLRYETIRRVDLAGETTHNAAAGMNVSVRQFFRYRSEAIAAIAQSIEKILRRPPDSHRHLLLLAKTIETIDPKAALEIYLRVPRSGGHVAYSIVRTTLWAGLEVSQEQIDACEGPWRLLALTAISRHLIALGRDEESITLRREIREQLTGNSGALYDAVAFELAAQDILEAHRRGNVVRAGAITETLRSLAGANEYLIAFAMTIEAQQYVLKGDLTAADLVLTDLEALEVHGRDHYIMARAAYCNAMLSLVRGFHEDAYAIANGARPAIAALEAGFGFRAASIAGRAALLAQLPWAPPHDLMEKYPNLWTRPETQGVVARHMLASDPAGARALAEAALERARHHQSAVIAVSIQPVIAAALDIEGKARNAQTIWLDVWEHALRFGDEFALYDMFVVPGAPQHDVGPLRFDDRFVDVLHRHIERSVTSYALTQANGLDHVSRALLRMAVMAGCARPESHAALIAQAKSAAAGLLRMHVSIDKARRVGASAARVAARAAGWLLTPQQRPVFQERLLAHWATAMEVIQSSMDSELLRLRA
ncbi:MAG: hypothetical protein M3Z41_06235 [Candidatus Eremiobacteraeota bacterium]|nr:hypothetical protein [Candidatus Eremiobacteraeota bacterium]